MVTQVQANPVDSRRFFPLSWSVMCQLRDRSLSSLTPSDGDDSFHSDAAGPNYVEDDGSIARPPRHLAHLLHDANSPIPALDEVAEGFGHQEEYYDDERRDDYEDEGPRTDYEDEDGEDEDEGYGARTYDDAYPEDGEGSGYNEGNDDEHAGGYGYEDDGDDDVYGYYN